MDAAVVELMNVFAEEVLEIADGRIEIKAAARIRGIRSKLAAAQLGDWYGCHWRLPGNKRLPDQPDLRTAKARED